MDCSSLVLTSRERSDTGQPVKAQHSQHCSTHRSPRRFPAYKLADSTSYAVPQSPIVKSPSALAHSRPQNSSPSSAHPRSSRLQTRPPTMPRHKARNSDTITDEDLELGTLLPRHAIRALSPRPLPDRSAPPLCANCEAFCSSGAGSSSTTTTMSGSSMSSFSPSAAGFRWDEKRGKYVAVDLDTEEGGLRRGEGDGTEEEEERLERDARALRASRAWKEGFNDQLVLLAVVILGTFAIVLVFAGIACLLGLMPWK